MKSAELEVILSQFLGAARNVEAEFKGAVAIEQETNNRTQDLLHTAELCPEILVAQYEDVQELVMKFKEIREDRRAAKQEVEVLKEVTDWVSKNKKSIDSLSQSVGAIRKIIRHQDGTMYRFKTNVVGNKDEYIGHKNNNGIEMEGQVTMDEWMASCAKENENAERD